MAQHSKNGKLSRTALRRQREKEQRYKTILTAAEKLFAQKGYPGTSMEEIAAVAEVSVGTVYFYFKNKEDLLIKLLDEIAFHLRELLGREFKKKDVQLEAFKLAGQSFIENFYLKYPEKVLILLRDAVGQGPVVEERRKVLYSRLCHDVHEALLLVAKNMGFQYRSTVSAEVMAISIVGMFERLAYHNLVWQEDSKDWRVIADDAAYFIMGGINSLMDINPDVS
ncbi:TetR/AcrR family transcriptional regulator [candidate division CSSED10-310 bacterium]|uniref:TetR/AcrR family transcriptional regulator n=1 Tax=candidate division CSSED10-310 bacterium TaxID=2855610 RepID=A0ABV6YZK5_UNCC1